MKKLRDLLYICFGLLILLFLCTAITYFFKFSNGISNKSDDWILFISICNWGFISLLTGFNVYVFFKLTSAIAQNDYNRFIENKVSLSEKAILEIRVSDFKLLREYAINIKLAIAKGEDYNCELNNFKKILLSMRDSRLFSCTDNKGSVLDSVVEYLDNSLKDAELNSEKLICHIDSALRTIELLIFSQQLRDDRILEEVRKHPNRFDVTLVGIDNYMKKHDESC